MSLYRLFRSPTAGAVPLRSARPLLHHRWHRCGLGVARLEDRTLLSGPSGDVLAAVAPKIELGTPKTGTLAPGEVAFFQIDPNTDGRLVARVHAEGATTRLSLLDVQGQVLMQSDGQSPGNFDDQIDLHLPAGPNYLEVESLGGAGTYTLTTTLTPGTPPFQPIPAGVAPTSPVAGDFNGDGRTDLAVANFGFSDVSVLLGNGDGTFQDQVRYAAGDRPRRPRGGGLQRRRPHRPGRRQLGLRRRVGVAGQRRRHLPGPGAVRGGDRAIRPRGGGLQRRRPH